MDLKEELDQARVVIQKLQTDKRDLSAEAKTARAYRDEIEMLKVQESKVEKLEAEVIKYKQKAEDTEYLKKKIQVRKWEEFERSNILTCMYTYVLCLREESGSCLEMIVCVQSIW